MRILQIHKYHHYLGGAEAYYLDLAKLLHKKGHQVTHFSMKDDSNLSNPQQKYFVSNVSSENLNLKESFRFFCRMSYSFEAKEKIKKLLGEFKPDVAHVHNIYYHLSPSILPELRKRNIPVVYTVHDYHLLSPNVNMFHSGYLCEDDGKNIFTAMVHKCIKDSFYKSLATASVFRAHKLFGLYKKNVNIYITPTKFLRRKLIEFGYEKEKVIFIPHFILPDSDNRVTSKKKFVLFFGRLDEHKGVTLLLEAASNLPEIDFKIAGQGPKENDYKKKASSMDLKNIEFLGFLSKEKMFSAIAESYFVVVPSIWNEVFGLSILEAFSKGKAVVASKAGGIPEIVQDGENGLLFKPGNIEEFVDKIQKLWRSPKLLNRLSQNAKKTAENKFSSVDHYQKLMLVYKTALGQTT